MHSGIPRYFLSKSRYYASKRDARLSKKYMDIAISTIGDEDGYFSESLGKLMRKARRDFSNISMLETSQD